jgi:hypothetical protein
MKRKTENFPPLTHTEKLDHLHVTFTSWVILPNILSVLSADSRLHDANYHITKS